jgi:hypothetical protein
MYSRVAYMIGTVQDADQQSFNRALERDVLTLIRSMPGVAQAHFHFTESGDDSAPGVYALLTIYFASEADMEKALNSPIRNEMQQNFRALLPKFSGTISHINSSVV